MSNNEARVYLLRDLAVETTNHDNDVEKDPSKFIVFRKIPFKKLINFNLESLLRDIPSNKDFSVRIVPPALDSIHRQLGLHFIAHGSQTFRADRRLDLLRIGFDVENILPTRDATDNSTEYLESYQHRKQTIAKLFQLLREDHFLDVLHPAIPEVLQCEFLKATLRPYQRRAVQWLLHREIAKEIIPHNFVEIRSFHLPNVPFYLQPDYLEITDKEPNDIVLPTGGILADEMGLGKTVEMLTLVLLNKRTLNDPLDIMQRTLSSEPPKKKSKMEISCLCGKDSARNVVQCNQCETFQHVRCTRKYASESDDDSLYLCPKCWEEQPQIKSNATIIVSPATIRQQWNSEIARHTQGVRVFTYDGVVVTGWISPIELARFDVILTDYNVLRKEIDFSHDKDIQLSLRNKRKYLRKSSPLNMIEWWRVILDEAQMVESGVTKSAQMVQKLAAIHRWAVTGTPIQKSIDDIRGLLEFVNVIPFFHEHMWSSLSAAFQKGNRRPLLNVLSKVMWRTCKANILEELGIPPQTEKIHYLVLSDVQRLFYRGQHSASMFAFDNVIRNYPVTMPLSQLDPKSLKKILEPLRKLRQDCTVPVIFKKMEQSQVKKCLTPKELVAHLISTNEIESKNHLRCMVSSINGQAALRIIRKEYGKAVELYKSVLDLAEKYNETISVDTLLQIHALHNLVECSKNATVPDLNEEIVKDYRTRCDKLEWKYLSIYNENFLKAQNALHQAQKAYLESAANLPKDKTVCWQSLLVTLEAKNLDARFLDKINEEFALTHGDLMANFRMIEGVSYFITTWVDKIFRLRDEILERFQKFQSYVQNIKPQSELTKEEQTIIESFVWITFNCHLFELQKNSKKEKKNKKKNQRLCDLCLAKKSLDEYECVIFNKIFDENRDNMEGSWKPTTQESFCKTILRFAKANDINNDDAVEATEFLKMLECIKTEYKEFIKLWIEIEYTVKAYDEINMCKLRLQLYDETANKEDEDSEEEKANYQIKKAEVDYYLEELADDYLVAESQFQRKLSRLKYIRHLESNEDPGICPICKHEPDAKYAMLQCGHHICMICLVGMKEHQRSVLTCAVCRFRQKYEEVYFVTRKLNDPDLDIIEVKGQHSSKVEEIVREVLKLKQSEKDVKIIIFSDWYAILGVISQALVMNDVNIAFKRNVTQAINLFKQPDSNITCLLLMLSQGSKGLNLTEATHVFLVEPILNPGEEQQAVGRVHRIGQTRPTTVHRFIMKETIEETIYNAVTNDDQGKWDSNDITINNIKTLFALDE